MTPTSRLATIAALVAVTGPPANAKKGARALRGQAAEAMGRGTDRRRSDLVCGPAQRGAHIFGCPVQYSTRGPIAR